MLSQGYHALTRVLSSLQFSSSYSCFLVPLLDFLFQSFFSLLNFNLGHDKVQLNVYRFTKHTDLTTVIFIPFCVLLAVPAVLQEALPVTSKSIANELCVTQTLVFKYTVVLEKLTSSDVQLGHSDMPVILLKQALYNARQHEVFLKMLLVRWQ